MTDYKRRLKNAEKDRISLKDVDKSAKILCRAMARAEGVSNGEIASQAIWKKAQEHYHPATIRLILKGDNISYDIDA